MKPAKNMTVQEVEAEIAYLTLVGTSIRAATEWRRRKQGDSEPAGRWDYYERFFLDQGEMQSCCAFVRYPSREFPNSLWRHAHTQLHVATLFGISGKELRRAVRLLERRDELK